MPYRRSRKSSSAFNPTPKLRTNSPTGVLKTRFRALLRGRRAPTTQTANPKTKSICAPFSYPELHLQAYDADADDDFEQLYATRALAQKRRTFSELVGLGEAICITPTVATPPMSPAKAVRWTDGNSASGTAFGDVQYLAWEYLVGQA